MSVRVGAELDRNYVARRLADIQHFICASPGYVGNRHVFNLCFFFQGLVHHCASRGFGTEIAWAALARGDRVVTTARKPETIEAELGRHDHLLAIALDANDEAQARAASRNSMPGRQWPSRPTTTTLTDRGPVRRV